MDSSSVPLFSLLTGRMSWLSSRQSVLAQNVANASTPGYQARDMKPMDFASLVAQSNSTGLAVTDPHHITGGAGGSLAPQSTRGSDEGTPTGNAVSLEEEMIKLSDTQVQYQAVTNLYAKMMGMFRTALGTRSQ